MVSRDNSPMPDAPRIMFIAGENSGDQHAARVLRELRVLLPGLETFGYGGERMEAEGMRLEENLAQKLPIIGLTQVIKNYGKLKELLTRAEVMLAERRPDAVVLVDYPGFNLRVARMARRLGIPVIYYISPQVWAWHRSRLKIIAENVDRMLVILPFEADFYREAGVAATYVGHPLQDNLEEIRPRDETLRALGLDPGRRVLGLIPGSRESEVVRHLSPLLEAARLLRRELPDLQFVLPRASTIPRALLDKYLARYPDVPVCVAEKDLKSVRTAFDFAVCKSGTSTLELALLGVPMIVIYKVSALTYWVARALVKIRFIGLVNIVAGDEVAPELIQHEASPQRIAETVLAILRDPQALERMQRHLAQVREKLGGPGASRRAAEAIAEIVRSRTAAGASRQG